MVLFIIVYEEVVSITEIMNISESVTKRTTNILKQYEPNRLLVRKLIMLLPDWLFKSPSRIVVIKSIPKLKLSHAELSIISESKDSDLLSDISENDSDTLRNSECSIGMVQLISGQPDIINNTSYNPYADEISSEYRIKELEQQLAEIREEIKGILFMITNKDKSSPNFEFSNTKTECKNENIIPPPAPPLPPVLSEMRCPTYRTPDKKIHTIHSSELSSKTLVTMADVLKEMNKVKLKPIQRTPGGRPTRVITHNKSTTNNLSPDLQAVLKRRYSAMHNISPKTPETPKIKRSSSQDSFYDNF